MFFPSAVKCGWEAEADIGAPSEYSLVRSREISPAARGVSVSTSADDGRGALLCAAACCEATLAYILGALDEGAAPKGVLTTSVPKGPPGLKEGLAELRGLRRAP